MRITGRCMGRIFRSGLRRCICGGISFLTFSVLLAGADVSIFALYVLTGLLGACLFSRLDEKYRIALPLFVSLSFLFAAETACVVLFANETLKWELFLIPALNVIISLILLLILPIFNLLSSISPINILAFLFPCKRV